MKKTTPEQMSNYLEHVATLSDAALLKVATNVPQYLFADFMYHNVIGKRLTELVRNRLHRSENAASR